jgi:type VI secretion system protein ImpB
LGQSPGVSSNLEKESLAKESTSHRGGFSVSVERSAKRSAAFEHNSSEDFIMAKQSAQHKLDRVRPPRVQITYDVEVGGAIEIKELPFVVGVLGDFTGNPEQPLPKLKERKFVEVNPDNFDTVLEGMKPHLSFAVENKLSDDPNAANLKVDLKFRKFDDFEPANVAKQVKPLKELLDLRTRLSDLRGSLQGNDKLEEVLLEAVGNTEKLDKLKGEIGDGGSNG